MHVLEKMVMENFEDGVMVNSLAKLQHAHISMTEKFNNIFAQSIQKQPSKQQIQQRKESETKSAK
jgi:hypothetical protein